MFTNQFKTVNNKHKMQMGQLKATLDSGQSSVRRCESILYLTIRQLWLRNAQWIQCVVCYMNLSLIVKSYKCSISVYILYSLYIYVSI